MGQCKRQEPKPLSTQVTHASSPEAGGASASMPFHQCSPMRCRRCLGTILHLPALGPIPTPAPALTRPAGM